MNSATITLNEALAAIQQAMERSATKRFTVIADDVAGRVVLEPYDDDDAKPYYELSPEGETSLKEAIAQAERGEVYPIETLFTRDA